MRELYRITKKQCEQSIGNVVCEGCGGRLEPIETCDNSGNPTFWVGCHHCQAFRSGVDKKYYEIARKLVTTGVITPYRHLNKYDYEKRGMMGYYWDSQTAGLSETIEYIERLLREYSGGD